MDACEERVKAFEKQLINEQKKIADLKKENAELRKALADEQEHHKSFLEVYLDGQYIKRAEEKENTAAAIRGAATPENCLSSENAAAILEKEACLWRQASRILRKGAATEFPRAQRIVAAMDDAEIPPQKSHLLLIALLFKLLADPLGGPRGVPKKIVAAAIEYRLNMSGLSKSSIEKMLAAAKKTGADHGLET